MSASYLSTFMAIQACIDWIFALLENILGGALGNGSNQESGAKNTKFELPMRLVSRDVKWKVECLEGTRQDGNINLGVVNKKLFFKAMRLEEIT